MILQAIAQFQPVPVHDPTSLTLPVDELDTLWQNLRIADVKPYDEKWAPDKQFAQNAIVMVRQALGVGGSSGSLKSERVWLDEDKEECASRP